MELQVHETIEQVEQAWDTIAPHARVALDSRHLRAIQHSGINRLAPYYLLAHDSGRLVGIAYCFSMDLDLAFLQKDLPSETVRTLRAWHPGFMRARMLECGFVAGLGEAMAAEGETWPTLAHAAVREMERIGREVGAEFLLIRDIPYSRWASYSDLRTDGYLPLLGFPMATMAVHWPSFDEYLAALKCTSRKRIRRYLAQQDAELETEVIAHFGEYSSRLAELWRQTHLRATDYSHEELSEAYFREIDRELADNSHIIAVKRRGEIVAFSLCLVGEEEYFSAHAGMDYRAAEDHNLYFSLSMAVLRDALSRGIKRINRGITTYDVKFELGFEAEPLVYLVKHIAQPRLTLSLTRRLQSAMPQPENVHRPFRDQDVSERTDLKALAAQLEPRMSSSSADVFEKAHAYQRADTARLSGLYGFFPPFESAQGPVIQYRGRPVVMLGSNAYLGLGTHPEVTAAAKAAVDKYGTGCSGSPVLNGTLDIHVDLARALADFMQKEDALLCSTGYQTNLGVVSALVDKDDILIMDRLDHASLVDGGRLAHAEVVRFRHNDMHSLEEALKRHADQPKLVVVDSVFSMEGTLADLPAIVALVRAYGARLMVDEAHAIGVLGPGGRGAAEHFGVLGQVDVVMGTFSKSLASVGGFVAGDARVIDYLRHVTRSHMFSASLPPASVAAARCALDIIQREPERRQKVLRNAELMSRRLQELGYRAPYRQTAIVPVHCGSDMLAYGLYKKLFAEGVFVNPVAEPAVPRGRELLRTSYMATHEEDMLERALDAFARIRTASFPVRES